VQCDDALFADSENAGVLRAAPSENGRGHRRSEWQRQNNAVEESEECAGQVWPGRQDLRHESQSHAKNSGQSWADTVEVE